MDYIQHNREEHEKAKAMAKEIENTTSAEKKRRLFQDLYVMIYGHHHGEEKAVFPVVMKKVTTKRDKDILYALAAEHSLIAFQFSVVNQTSVDNETWPAKFSVLMEVLEQHMEEEENKFTKLAQRLLSREKLEVLLRQWEEASKKYAKEKRTDLSK